MAKYTLAWLVDRPKSGALEVLWRSGAMDIFRSQELRDEEEGIIQHIYMYTSDTYTCIRALFSALSPTYTVRSTAPASTPTSHIS